MEYASQGKLLSVLRALRPTPGYYNDNHTLKTSALLKYLHDITAGMAWVAAQGVVHRDLAARNVLVTVDGVCKIADFGLARYVGVNNSAGSDELVYEQASRGPLPVRWMAPESLAVGKFSLKSDVWAWGVLLWELVTLGATPYPAQSAAQVMAAVKAGRRMERPAHCDQKVYELMETAWRQEANRRPTFGQLLEMVNELMKTTESVVDLRLFADNQYYTFNELKINRSDERI